MPDDRLVERVPTPDPDEFAVRVWVPPDKITTSLQPATGVTTYAEFKIHPAVARLPECDAFVYTYATNARADGFIPFHFAKPKTAAEKRVPYATKLTTGAHPWDTVVKEVIPIPDYTSKRSGLAIVGNQSGIFTGPEWRCKRRYIPGGSYQTRFLRRDYFAPTVFDCPRPRAPVPAPLIVQLPGGREIEFPACLREEIFIRAMQSTDRQLVGATSSALGGLFQSQTIPETRPFTRWCRHIILRDQTQESGGWHYWEIEAIPPDEPEESLD